MAVEGDPARRAPGVGQLHLGVAHLLALGEAAAGGARRRVQHPRAQFDDPGGVDLEAFFDLFA